MNLPESIKLEKVNCNLCGSKKQTYLFSEKDRDFRIGGYFKIVKCRNCGLVFTNPRPSAVDIIRFYPNNYGPYSPQITHFGIIKKIISVWEDYKGLFSVDLVENLPRGRILDVGCGNGAYLNYLRKRGWQVFRLDPIPEAVRQTLSLGIECYQGEVYDAGLEQNFFDVVSAINSLEHMHDPLRNLRKINQILKKDGYLILVVPNIESLEARIFGRHWHEWDIPRHLYHFSPRTLGEMLKLSGFKIISIDHESRIDGLLRSIDLALGEKMHLLIYIFGRFLYPVLALLESKIFKGFLIMRARKER